MRADGRIIFIIPDQTNFTPIGPTDEDYAGDPGRGTVSNWKITYPSATVNTYLN